jgi:hypothetical protein
MNFKIPSDANTISERIFENAKKLVALKYWDGIRDDQLLNWLQNFDTERERYIAAIILYRLIYRNQQTINTFGAQLFQITIPDYLEKKDAYTVTDLDEWQAELNRPDSRSRLPFRFTTIESVDDKPAKSGASIYRALKGEFFEQNLGVAANALFKLKDNPQINTLILFDDILGTGQQFIDFVEKYNLDDLGMNILYCPFAAFEKGLANVRKKFPNIDLRPVEVLTKENSVFCTENKLLSIENGSISEECKLFYLEMCKKKGFKLPTNEWLGRGGLSLSYIFNDSTPNNNISAIWYSDNNWKRLAKR